LNWAEIAPEDIRTTFTCPDCGDAVRVNPEEMGENGNPFCPDCDVDMTYITTELRIQKT